MKPKGEEPGEENKLAEQLAERIQRDTAAMQAEAAKGLERLAAMENASINQHAQKKGKFIGGR